MAALSFFSDCFVYLPFAVNGASTSLAATDAPPATLTVVVPEDGALSSSCFGTSSEEAPVPEVPVSSEHNGCVLSDGMIFGSGAGSDLDPAASASGNSSAFESVKLRQPGGCVEPGTNTSTETLPSGYVVTSQMCDHV